MSPKECGYQHGQPNGLCHQGHDASAHLRWGFFKCNNKQYYLSKIHYVHSV